jgi:hypothetical protein
MVKQTETDGLVGIVATIFDVGYASRRAAK